MAAILQKHLRLPLYKEDGILNVAGGLGRGAGNRFGLLFGALVFLQE